VRQKKEVAKRRKIDAMRKAEAPLKSDNAQGRTDTVSANGKKLKHLPPRAGIPNKSRKI